MNKVPWRESPTSDYDMRGFFKAWMQGDPRATWQGPGSHFPDVWKTPFHQTFSNESMYATPDAPRWVGNRLVTKEGSLIRDESPRLNPSISELIK